MQTNELIPAKECCKYYNIESSFIYDLQDHGLIEITVVEEEPYIPAHRLTELEKLIRLHYDLEINIEGMEAIAHMLQRMESLQNEVMFLKQKLRMFE